MAFSKLILYLYLFYILFHVKILFIASIGRLTDWMGAAQNRDVDIKKNHTRIRKQFFFITQKNCDLNDTSIMQSDEPLLSVNANCEYDIAVNVSYGGPCLSNIGKY